MTNSPMSNIDKRALREAAANAKIAGEAPVMPFDQRITALNDFMKHCTPETVLVLLDEMEAKGAGLQEYRNLELVYQCEFCHHDSAGELQWHWEDVNKDFYDQYDSERRGKRRILYTALPVVLSETAEVARAALNYIDCIPADIAAALPAMPGFDRDWAENVLAETIPKGVGKCI